MSWSGVVVSASTWNQVAGWADEAYLGVDALSCLVLRSQAHVFSRINQDAGSG